MILIYLPIEVHDEQQLLLQKPFLNSCQIGVEDVLSDVLPQPSPCGEQIAKSNRSLQSINKPLQMLSQPLSSTMSCQDLVEEPEV